MVTDLVASTDHMIFPFLPLMARFKRGLKGSSFLWHKEAPPKLITISN